MGVERDAAWYDESYSKWEWRDKPAEGTPWTPLWLAILAHIKPEDRVLDLGCGAGHLAELREARDGTSGTWLGYDFSIEAVDAARRRDIGAGVRFFQGDLAELTPDVCHDANVVVLSEVLEHIQGDLGVLAQIPSGKRVILSVPNFDSEGHVRWFNESGEVFRRYAHLFEEWPHLDRVVSANPERWWFVLAGVRK